MKQLIFAVFLFLWITEALSLPPGFVYLKEVDPSIIQEIRYAGYHNFVGRPIRGYEVATCILTQQAANALKNIQQEVNKKGFSLKVYDCYRPTQAVADFLMWSKNSTLNPMKGEFYPRVNKGDLFNLGYVAPRSGHSRGSTVDLTLVKTKCLQQAVYTPAIKLVACYAPLGQRFRDNSIEMGSGYDCMDKVAHSNCAFINKRAQLNRQYLKQLMIKHGFVSYPTEWWHFTLRNEPFFQNYYNFPVR